LNDSEGGLRVIELFAGCGGLALGLSRAGFKHELLVDIDPHACQTLISNRALGGWDPGAVVNKGAADVDYSPWDNVDLLAAGVPCQPFSHAGMRSGHEDDRNQFPALLATVRLTRPKAVLVENVFGLVRPTFADYFLYILEQLRRPSLEPLPHEDWRSHFSRLSAAHNDPEYVVDYQVIEAADYGTPQLRRRVFILGWRRDTTVHPSWPVASHSRDALLNSQANGEYWDRHGLVRRVFSGGKSPRLLPWQTVRDAFIGLGSPAVVGPTLVPDHRLILGARSYVGHTGSSLDFPAKTLKAGVHGVAGGEASVVDDLGVLRYFTVREAARLQDFPDDFVLPALRTRAMRQLGNAVPVRVAEALGRGIREAILTSQYRADAAA
jgi:DNA (cytosine-5)-methyltransferase 1